MPRTRTKPDWAVKANLRGIEAVEEHRPRCIGWVYCHGINVRKVTIWRPDGTVEESWDYSIGRGGTWGCGVGFRDRDEAVLAAMRAAEMLRHPEEYREMWWGGDADA